MARNVSRRTSGSPAPTAPAGVTSKRTRKPSAKAIASGGSDRTRSRGGPCPQDDDPGNDPNPTAPTEAVTTTAKGKKRQLAKQNTAGRSNGAQSSSAPLLQNEGPPPDAGDELVALKAAYAKIQAEKVALERELNETREAQPASHSREPVRIPKPAGTAGRDWSIQQAMELDGTPKKRETYKALQRCLHELTLNARIAWEQPWPSIPARDKATLFEAAREQHPILGRYVNDWATEELVKQYIKNKRKNAYKRGYLTIPDGFQHLKGNSGKRSQAPRTSRVRMAQEALKKASKTKVVTGEARQTRDVEMASDEEGSNMEVEDSEESEGGE